jgi:hypothetical protein
MCSSLAVRIRETRDRSSTRVAMRYIQNSDLLPLSDMTHQQLYMASELSESVNYEIEAASMKPVECAEVLERLAAIIRGKMSK